MNRFFVARWGGARYAARMRVRHIPALAVVAALCLAASGSRAQDVPAPAPPVQDAAPPPAPPVPPEFPRQMGRDAVSGIEFVLISMDGRLLGSPAAAPTPAPRLTAQCTKSPDGKMHFELLADAGGVAEVSYIPPWRPTKDLSVQPPVHKLTVTMDFIGYMKVKPVKREWRDFREIPGELHYVTPSMHSGNMEEIAFYMQYLKALPTLRLTIPDVMAVRPPVVVEFETAKWQQRVKAEPMCWASAL